MIRRHISNLMCRFATTWDDKDLHTPSFAAVFPRLEEMVGDGLITLSGNRLQLTRLGKPFVRYVCMALDARLWRRAPETQLFSQAI